MTGGPRRADDPAPDGRELDLRLALGAGVAWLAVALCLTCSWAVAAVVGAGCLVLGGACLVVGRRRSAGRTRVADAARAAAVARVVALIAFCTALVLLPLAATLAHAGAGVLQTLARRHGGATLELTVTADPRPLAATGPGGVARVAVETDADAVVFGGRPIATDGEVLVLADASSWRDVLPGQRVRLDGSLQPDLEGSVLSVTLFARGSAHLLGRPPWYQRMAGRIRSSLRGAVTVLPSQERGLLPGLVDGDTSALDPVLAERFRLAGLTHLVAVSGLNCQAVVTFSSVNGLIRALRRRAPAAWCARPLSLHRW